MQKLYILISAFLFASLASQAAGGSQEQTTLGAPLGNHFPHFNSDLNGGNPNVGWRAARLISKAFLKYDGTSFMYVDSTTYGYGNRRGSSPNPDDLNNDEHVLFDDSYTYEYVASKSNFANKVYRHQNFDQDNKVKDLTYQNWNTNKTPPQWWNKDRFLYSYDAAGKMTASYYQTWTGNLWIKHVNSTLVYDANDNVKQFNSTGHIVDYAYDGSDNLVSVVDQRFDQSTNSWDNFNRKTYSYKNDNINIYVLEVWAGAAWVKTSRWEYEYNSNDKVIESTEYTWNGISWDRYKKNFIVYDTNDNLIEDVEQVWSASSNSYVNNKKEIREYNEFNQPTLSETFTWKVNTWDHTNDDELIRFHYEIYDPTDVSEFVLHEGDVNVYPVPAVNQLNIDADLKGGEHNADIVIIDMLGKTVYHSSEQVAGSYHKTIQVDGIPSGNYIVSLRADKAVMTKQISINH